MYFKTNRLVIDKLNEEDTFAFFEYRSKPEVALHQSWNNYTIEDATYRIKLCSIKPFDKNSSNYNMAVRFNNNLIGDIFLQPSNKDKIIVGYTLDSQYWRQGFATEMLEGLFYYLKNNLGFQVVICHIYQENTASKKLLEKSGFECYKQSSFFKDESYKKIL